MEIIKPWPPFLLQKIKKKEIEIMLQNNEKTAEVLKAEKREAEDEMIR